MIRYTFLRHHATLAGVEQYHKQVKKTGYGGETAGAHHEGIEAENAVNGTVRGPQKALSATQHADGTLDAVVEVPYTLYQRWSAVIR